MASREQRLDALEVMWPDDLHSLASEFVGEWVDRADNRLQTLIDNIERILDLAESDEERGEWLDKRLALTNA